MTGYTAGKPEPFEVKPGDERNAMFSPDGRWVAYQSDEGGTTQVYVTSFPSKTVRMQISTAGGSTPLWSRDGRELFYYSQRAVYSVPITPGDRLEHGQPRELFKAPAAPRAVSLDGKRFLVPVPGERGKDPIHVIVNWERLRAKGGELN
jgi:dipeptidyl aminopeptidase/acylaminoacyl peptidase